MIVEWWFMMGGEMRENYTEHSYDDAKRQAEIFTEDRPQFLIHKDTGKCEMKAPGMPEWKMYPDLDTAAVAARLRG